MRKIIAITFLVALCGYALFQAFADNNSKNSNSANQVGDQKQVVGIQAGEEAYDFELNTLEGDTVKLSDYKGKKVIVNFWATWCGPCRAEMPEMQEFSEDNDDVVMLALNLTGSEKNIETVQEYVEEGGYTFPILLDEKSVYRQFEVPTMPTTYFIDSEGIVTYRHIGPMTYELMEEKSNEMN